MANSVNTQIILDGPRNAIVKIDGILDSSDYAATAVVTTSTMWGWDTSGLLRSAKVRIYKIHYSIEDTLEVRLYWDATTPQRILELTGRGHMDFRDFSGLTNNAVAGVTGNILLATEGWATGKILSFTVVLELIKQQN